MLTNLEKNWLPHFFFAGECSNFVSLHPLWFFVRNHGEAGVVSRREAGRQVRSGRLRLVDFWIFHVRKNHEKSCPIGSMVLLYMVTWIPSIYPLYVSIYSSTMDPSWLWIYFLRAILRSQLKYSPSSFLRAKEFCS
jgi:hypothetical protein